MNVAELIEELGQCKSKAQMFYQEYQTFKQEEDRLKSELLIKLTESGLTSAKGKDYQATISVKPDIQITHEQSVINWLKETPNIESDVYIGLKKTEFKGLALQILKDTGEILPGTEVGNKQVLSVRSNKVRRQTNEN